MQSHLCSCPRCLEMAEAFVKQEALKTAKASPGDHEDFRIGLAS